MDKHILIKGTLYLTIAQIVFVISSYILHIGLARHLGPEKYGIFGVILYLIVMARSIVNRGIPQSVSKYIAENEHLATKIKNKGLLLQAVFAGVIFIIYILCAPVLSNLLNDPELTKYIQLSAFNIPFFGLYMIYIYSLNGKREFSNQAKVGIIHDMLLPIIVLGTVACGLSLYGAIAGLTISAIVGCMIGHIYCSRFDNTTSNDNVSMIKLIRFAIPVTIFAILTSSLLNVDLLLVKGILNENIYAGFYTAARSLATTPFFLSIALSRSMFPSIAKSVSENNPEVTRQYIHQGLRLLLLWIVPLVVIVSSTSYALVEFIYSVEYIPAGEPLSILIIGLGFFTVYLILTTIITAGGRPVIAMWINVIALCMDVGLNLYLIPRYDIKGAAIGTSTAMFTGVIIAGGYVLYRFKALISLMCVIRIILGVIPVWLITILTHVKGCWLIPWYIFLFGIYIVTLSLLQEIKGKELFHIREIISEHKQKKG